MTLNVHYKGRIHSLLVSNETLPTIADLQRAIELEVGVNTDAQRLFQKHRRINCSDVSRLLSDVCDCSATLFLVAGASKAQIEDMKSTQDAVQRESSIRENRRVVDISKRNQELQARDAISMRYRFHAIEPLRNFQDKEKAQEILEKLAKDRGILAVLAKHKWSVGVLAEMSPDGKVGVDPVCVLGLNQNKGQKILLRLRTDDLLGFRKYLSIKKVHSEHDQKFYQLMRQVEKECNELDWTISGGAAVGGSRMILSDEDKSTDCSSSGRRLGGESAGASRLLHTSATVQEELVSTSKPKVPPTEQNQLTGDVKIGDTESTMVDAVSLQQTHTTPTVAVHEKTVDEEVATLAMSDRERRIYDAVRHLQAHYSAETISNSISWLYKIVTDIITHPLDVKFRSIRKANQLFNRQIARFPECLEFLRALGFEDQSDKFVLVREDPALLWIGRSTLEKLLSAA
ncbi:hypothetical protein DD237_001658 [Peronospora effusa]|uniref:WLM domain-containing protein n=1 Tax=Peronospora effusa TaxID=542832 RepID=A0A425CL74_9STRA|nr:hypothetical protein DD237_001658 [Peronospora effusa]